jgi:hypothetical protein
LEQADRGRCTVEQELSDTNETLSDQTCTNQAIEGARRNLEQEMQALNFRECRLGKSGGQSYVDDPTFLVVRYQEEATEASLFARRRVHEGSGYILHLLKVVTDRRTVSNFVLAEVASTTTWTKPAQERGQYQKPEGPFIDVHVLNNVLKHIRRNSELPESQRLHVPFQSSTLTRILQPYLSPGSCTLLASIPEPPTATDETHRSLTYGLDPVITMWMAPAPVQKVPGHHRVVASPASPVADTIFKEVKEQECPLCQAVYTEWKSLNRHIRLDHWTTCHLCFRTYKSRQYLMVHNDAAR